MGKANNMDGKMKPKKCLEICREKRRQVLEQDTLEQRASKGASR